MKTPARQKYRLLVWQNAEVAVLFLIAVRLGEWLASPPSELSPVWPAAGIGLAAVLLARVPVWPGILAGAFAGRYPWFAAAGPALLPAWIAALVSAVLSAMQALLAAHLFRRWVSADGTFASPAAVFRFGAIAALVCALTVALCVTLLGTGGYLKTVTWSDAWLGHWLARTTGMVIVAPAILLAARPAALSGRTWTEAGLLALAMAAAGALAFTGWLPRPNPVLPLDFLVLPVLVLAAFRMPINVPMALVLLMAVLAVAGTRAGYGPFALGELGNDGSLLALQAYLLVVAVTTLAGCATIAQLARTRGALERAKHATEDEVRLRTAELAEAYARLRRETAERRGSELRLRLLMRYAHDAILITRPDGAIVEVNERAVEIYGYSSEEFARRNVCELFASPACDPPHGAERVLERQNGRTYEAEHRRKDGSRLVVEVSARLVDVEGEEYQFAIIRDVTERIQAREALEDSERRLKEAQRIARMGYWELDLGTGEVIWSELMYDLFDRDPALGPPSLEEAVSWYRPQDRAAIRDMLQRAVVDGECPSRDALAVLPSGRTVWHASPVAAVRDSQGRVVKLRGAVLDTTERKQAEEQMRLATTVFENCREGILVSDASNTILSVNPAFTAITGYSREEAQGQNPGFLRSGHQDQDFYGELWDAVLQNGHWEGEIWDRRKNGEVYAEWLSITAVRTPEGEISHHIGIFSDVTERIEATKRIKFLAHHDPLTGLPNRTLLGERIEQALAQAHRTGQRVAVMYLDLDRFKTINDSLGHPVGDELLKGVAARIKQSVRDADTVARLGGDEFVVALCGLEDAEAASRVAIKMLDALCAPYDLMGHEVVVTPSIGIAVYPQDGDRPDVLAKHADIAMYHAKESGRANFQFFSPPMNARASERLELEHGLRTALERGEFEVYYQPQVELATRRIVGAEALLRWRHPERGLVRPDKFIQVAEDSGLIVAIGEWVLRAVCAQSRQWQRQGLPQFPVAINLSAAQFRSKDLPATIATTLRESGIEARALELELTEGSLMQHSEANVGKLAELKAMGLHLAVDDFGTGYSSLSYLKHFPIERVKIDQSFVRDAAVNENDAAITTAIIRMAKSLRLDVVAEGVESQEVANLLRREGCDKAQGFLFAEPVPAKRFAELLMIA